MNPQAHRFEVEDIVFDSTPRHSRHVTGVEAVSPSGQSVSCHITLSYKTTEYDPEQLQKLQLFLEQLRQSEVATLVTV